MTRPAERSLTADAAREVWSYDAETGFLYWKVRRNSRAPAGQRAGSQGPRGYRRVAFDRVMYLEHRVIWLVAHGAWPLNGIDHINRVKWDNRLSNLREATNSENQRNIPCRSNNHSGFRGVCWNKKAQHWRAYIYVDGRQIHLGCFGSAELAHAAYLNAARVLHGEFSYSVEPARALSTKGK